MAAADRPVKAFSIEITTGMSAPPIGSTTALPSSAAHTSMPMKTSFGVVAGGDVDAGGDREDQQHEVDDLLGRAERDRAPGDDFLELAEGDVRAPEGDRADDRGEQREDRDVGRRCARSRRCRRNSAQAIRNTAPPPTPLNSATICGIAVIFTWRAAGTPTAVPSAMPSTISPQLPSLRVEQRGDHGDRHADGGDAVAAHRGRRPRQARAGPG